MNICITGALGHIGSKLIRNLSVPSLNKVYLIDNFLTQRYASLFDLPSGTDFHFYEMDILSDEIEAVIEDSDVLVHLAAITDAETSFQKVELVEKTNKTGLEHIARLCAKHNCALIFFSTTSVYGTQKDEVDENCTDSDLKPQSPYAQSKFDSEKFLQSFGEKNKIDFVILRVGTIFGYSIGMRFHTAVNKFVWQAASGNEITVWKTALNQMRPYCGLNDCVNAVNHIITDRIFDGEIYNILTDNFTVKDILDVIRNFIPDIKVTFVDSRIMNQLSYRVSHQKSLKKGFLYRDSLKEIIQELIDKLKNINSSIVKKNL
jgi:UDP-glucose 4-epimerase